MSYLFHVDSVILCVRPNKPNVHHPVWIIYPDNESILVSANIENHAVVGHDTGRAKCRFDRCGALPVRVRRFSKPRFERLLSIGVTRLFPKQPESFAGNDPHRRTSLWHDPILGAKNSLSGNSLLSILSRRLHVTV